ncbi:fungal-specific transcription factor domain-containing protein [Tirmania nivea]|nr:fungal-specific transcription factor domain-containing protein [Tirmania nivea]
MTETSTWTSSLEVPAVAGVKRSATTDGNAQSTSFRAVKRRASKACQCCRARKVRCNVVEHGAPCTNCRLDEVECIITESKRRKKFWGAKVDQQKDSNGGCQVPSTTGSGGKHDSVAMGGTLCASPEGLSLDNERLDHGSYDPHFPCQQAQSHLGEEMAEVRRPSYAASNASVPSLSYSSSAPASTACSIQHAPHRSRAFELPHFIKPTPARIPIEDLEFLAKKGALQLPEENLRNEILKAHFKFVHPFMPLLDRKEFMEITMGLDTSGRKIGLLLFQAVMFTGSAFINLDLLRAAGYPTRKAARKDFFTKARLLYDFDHEPDRMSLVQALLLLTYWYETPDDQKDTWHWMGVAISLSHTIGLHRNSGKSIALDGKGKKLWKRVWWSCVMRDRLVALGMRRPTRIKSEDCDVPMLTLEDFDIDMDVSNISLLSEEGESYEQAINRERQLAIMCIEKAKLCICISHVLTAQYSVLNTNQGSLAADGSTKTTMVLLPKAQDKDSCEVQRCDASLQDWVNRLPEEAVYRPVRGSDGPVNETLGLHRNLLHMVYYTTVSALHRPQVLPSAPAPWPSRNINAALQDISRRKVRQAATEITRLAAELIDLNLVQYLPTFGVTVMLPAIIIHLLDIKSSNQATRDRSIEGFNVCMQVMHGLRATYASADYATHFLEAAIKKADIYVSNTRRWRQAVPQLQTQSINPMSQRIRRRRTNKMIVRPSKGLLSNTLTPPPDHITIAEDGSMEMSLDGGDYALNESPNANNFYSNSLAGLDINGNTYNSNAGTTVNANNNNMNLGEDTTLQLKLESFLATTPPPPSSEGVVDQDIFDEGASPGMLFSATTPPPASITIPSEDDYNSNHDNTENSPATSIDAILGWDVDPFLGHYEDGAELSLRENGENVNNAKNYFNSGWGGFVNTDSMQHTGGVFGNGGWMEGGVDMESVGKLIDGVEFDLEDGSRMLESKMN